MIYDIWKFERVTASALVEYQNLQKEETYKWNLIGIDNDVIHN